MRCADCEHFNVDLGFCEERQMEISPDGMYADVGCLYFHSTREHLEDRITDLQCTVRDLRGKFDKIREAFRLINGEDL